MLRPHELRKTTRTERACDALAFVLMRAGIGITAGGWWPWQSSVSVLDAEAIQSTIEAAPSFATMRLGRKRSDA